MNKGMFIKSEYNFGRTLAPLAKLISKLKELEVTHAFLIDTDTWGHAPFFTTCTKAGIIPVLGVQWIVSDCDDIATRMIFIAKNTAGLSELYQALSKSYHQKVATRKGNFARLFKTDVLAMTDNIIKIACDIVDKSFLSSLNNIYIDIDFNGSDMLNSIKKDISKELNIDILEYASNSYINGQDKDIFEFLPFARSSLKDLSLKYIESLGMNKLCSDIDIYNYSLPHAPMIKFDGDIDKLCKAGIKSRFIDKGLAWTAEYQKRLDYELNIIKSKSFDSYFLVVHDLVSYAKNHMLVGCGRGSCAGSLVCYLLHITEINPIPANLMFERFIDLNRIDLPDIDLDFPDDKRQMVIDYLVDKYGKNHVAHVGNIATLKAKSALIMACKKLNIDLKFIAVLKENIINSLDYTFKNTSLGVEFAKKFPLAAKASAFLEGHVIRSGVHAAGVLVCNDEITKYCVVDDNGIAHCDKHAIEQLNLLKIDVLGLRTLTILADTSIKIDWYNLPLNDKKAFDLFNKNLLSGIFQFEGNALRKLTANAGVINSINTIDSLTALGRPGPLNSGVAQEWINRRKGKASNNIKALDNLLKDTHGLPLYQENSMQIVRELGGFDWSQTSRVRKAIAKSQGKEALQDLEKLFKDNALKKGLSNKDVTIIWDTLLQMGAYQMNKAHTYSYAVISYWCAYFKANYPLEFLASSLRHAKDDDSAKELLKEFVREGYTYKYFDIEKSRENWSVIDGQLIGGFMCLDGIADTTAKKLVDMRNKGLLQGDLRKRILAKDSIYKDVFYIDNKYADFYQGKITREPAIHIAAIPPTPAHLSECIIIGQVTDIAIKDKNEQYYLEKRGGERIQGNSKFVDIKVQDCTSSLLCRLSEKDYTKYADSFFKEVKKDSILLLRLVFFNNIRFAFIKKFKVLE